MLDIGILILKSKMMNNRFFNRAFKNATGLLRKNSRLLLLITQLGTKINSVGWKETQGVVKDRFFVLGRMTKAYAQGKYRNVPWKTMALIVGAILYFIDPVDFIPDFIPVTGLTDDLGILLWVVNHVSDEIDKFILWEQDFTLAK